MSEAPFSRELVDAFVVTHDMQRAGARFRRTTFFYFCELVEYVEPNVLFTKPKHRRTEQYITSRFG